MPSKDETIQDRFTAMCVPGDLGDGADTTWFVYDLVARTSEKIGAGAAARDVAITMAKECNRLLRQVVARRAAR